MKKYVCLAVAGMLAFSGCDVDGPGVGASGPRSMNFAASYEAFVESKATMSGPSVSFEANDEVSILSALNPNISFTTFSGGGSVSFSGSAMEDSKYYAIFPYTDGLSLEGNTIKGVSIPEKQENGGWNDKRNEFAGCDPHAPVAYAVTGEEMNLKFKGVCAILKVGIDESSTNDVDYLYVRVDGSQHIWGKYNLDTSTGKLTYASSGGCEIRVGDDTGINAEERSKQLFIAVAPGTYSNFELGWIDNRNEFDNDHGEIRRDEVTFESGKLYDFGSIGFCLP